MQGTRTQNEAWIPLSEIGLENLAEVGGKAGRCGEPARAGFDVPEVFVIPARFCGREAEVKEAVADGIRALGPGRLAVRSSGLAEDLEDASFAGQYETVLGVESLDEVLEAMRRCWASAEAERVRDYAEERANGQAGKVAVLVQRLVEADAAGVAYSANPVTGDRQEATVSAVRGLGERLVSGQSDPDEWIVRGAGAEARRRSEDAIDATRAQALADLARRAADRFGSPQDIEWAIAGDRLFLLQSRPITALPEQVCWEPDAPG